MITISPLVADDMPWLAEQGRAFNQYIATLYGEVNNNPYDAVALARDGLGQQPLFSCVVARYNNERAGWAAWTAAYALEMALPYWLLDDFYVAESWRRHGIGRHLLAYLQRAAKTAGMGWIDIWVAHKNNDAQEFYRACGATDLSHARLLRLPL